MKILVAVSMLLVGLFKCQGSEKTAEYVPVGCSEIASVVDFTGLDGCGLMLVLEDGSRLNPEKRVYVQAPKREDDPLYYFTLVAGEKIKVSYKETNGMDACMAGKTVFITCITKIE
jgi:hypothetical protein